MRLYKPEGISGTKFTGFKIETVKNFMEKGTIVEAPVVKCDGTDLSLHFDLGNHIYGVMPFEEVEYNSTGVIKSIAAISRVAKYTCFKVMSMETDEDGKIKCMLSRKEAQIECRREYIDKLQVGQIIDAKINHVEDYGAFCDIGCGVVALLPIEYFCVTRIRNSKSTLKKFNSIKAIVKSIGDDGRILLTHKELLGTWQEEADKFNPGEIVAGTVRLIESYGVFVELTPNLSGLAEPVAGVNPGDTVSVYIKSIVPEKMKVKLVIVNTDNVERPFIKLDYRIPEEGFIRKWVYSPEGCTKYVESVIVADEADTVE